MASATFLQMCSNEDTNSSTTWMAWWGVHFQFWANPLFLPLNIVEGHLDFNKCIPVQVFFFYLCTGMCVEGGCKDEWRCLDMSRTRRKQNHNSQCDLE